MTSLLLRDLSGSVVIFVEFSYNLGDVMEKVLSSEGLAYLPEELKAMQTAICITTELLQKSSHH